MILYLSVDIMAACNMISTNREASSLENSIKHCIPRTTGIHKKEYSPEPARHMEKYPLRFQISSIKRYLYRAQKGISRMISAAKKALLVTTVSGFVPQFEMNNVRILQNMGFEVHYAANYNTPSYGNDNHRLDGTGIIRHQIDFVRSPFKTANLRVYRQLCSLMEKESFQLVHCHTPMGGVMARLAAHATHTGPVIYTAHGFHFFKGAKPVNWLCYYPMERFLSRYTDQQICINHEDYQRAKKDFHARYTDYIPGVGIDPSRIPHPTREDIKKKKAELGLPSDKIILLSSGELIKRKNHETILKALNQLKDETNIHYLLCGQGKLDAYLREMAEKMGISHMITFAGYREDILEILQAADLFLFPSYQEGLPMALLEAMASGLPIICSDIRGSQDLMGEILAQDSSMSICSGGIMIKKADDAYAYSQAIRHLLEHPDKFEELGQKNVDRSELFCSDIVNQKMESIYQKICTGC